jgi:hypothetical protein
MRPSYEFAAGDAEPPCGNGRSYADVRACVRAHVSVCVNQAHVRFPRTDTRRCGRPAGTCPSSRARIAGTSRAIRPRRLRHSPMLPISTPRKKACTVWGCVCVCVCVHLCACAVLCCAMLSATLAQAVATGLRVRPIDRPEADQRGTVGERRIPHEAGPSR